MNVHHIDHKHHMISYENLTLSYDNTWDNMRHHGTAWDIMIQHEKSWDHMISYEKPWGLVHCLHYVHSWVSVNVYSTAFDNSVCWTYDYCLQMWLHNSFMMIIMSYLYEFWYYAMMHETTTMSWHMRLQVTTHIIDYQYTLCINNRLYIMCIHNTKHHFHDMIMT